VPWVTHRSGPAWALVALALELDTSGPQLLERVRDQLERLAVVDAHRSRELRDRNQLLTLAVLFGRAQAQGPR
jgi:hypothetical protein